MNHCRDCRWYIPMPGVAPDGECHRYPPTALAWPDGDWRAVWPPVEDYDGCGEWQSNEETP